MVDKSATSQLKVSSNNLEPQPKLTDFEIVKKVGKGAFGAVYLAKYKTTNTYVALKQLDKQFVLKQGKQESVMREKTILKAVKGAPFIIDLVNTFMDAESLYFVFEHCQFGSLANLIMQKGKFQTHEC